MASVGTEGALFTRFEGENLSWSHWLENIACATLDWGYSVTVIKSGEGYEAKSADSCCAMLYSWLNPLTYLGLIIRSFSSEHAEKYREWQASLTPPPNTPPIPHPTTAQTPGEGSPTPSVSNTSQPRPEGTPQIPTQNNEPAGPSREEPPIIDSSSARAPAGPRHESPKAESKHSRSQTQAGISLRTIQEDLIGENPEAKPVDEKFYEEKFTELSELAKNGSSEEITKKGKSILIEMAQGDLTSPYFLGLILSHIPVSTNNNESHADTLKVRHLMTNALNALISESSLDLTEVLRNHESLINFMNICGSLPIKLSKEQFALLKGTSDAINKEKSLSRRTLAAQGFLTLALGAHSKEALTASEISKINPSYLKVGAAGLNTNLRRDFPLHYANSLQGENCKQWGQVFDAKSLQKAMETTNQEMRDWLLQNYPESWCWVTDEKVAAIFSKDSGEIAPYFTQGMQNSLWCEKIVLNYPDQVTKILQETISLPPLVLVRAIEGEDLPNYLMDQPGRTENFFLAIDPKNEELRKEAFNCFTHLGKDHKVEAYQGIIGALNRETKDSNISSSLDAIISFLPLVELIDKLTSKSKEDLNKSIPDGSFIEAYLLYKCANDPNNLSRETIEKIVSSNGLPYLFATGDKALLEQLKNELQNNIQLLANNQMRKGVNMESIHTLMELEKPLKKYEAQHALYMEVCGEKINELRESIDENRTMPGTCVQTD